MKTHQLEHNETVFNGNPLPLTLICDGIKSPENIGMIFRLCDAMGVKKIIFISGTLDIDSSRIKRTARSTIINTEYEIEKDAGTLIKHLISQKVKIIGLELTNKSIPIHHFDFRPYQPMVLVIGSERHGISSELLEICEHTLEISMQGKNSSMNVVNALSIALYEINKQLSYK